MTRIVEVIPRPIRYALAGLAGLALLLAAGFGLVAGRGRRLERERQGLSDDVGLLQSALLPALPGTINGTAISGAYRAADGLAAGGDFFDAFPLGEHSTAVIVGDVAGHGRDAVPVTALVRYTLRAYLEAGLAPRQALEVAGAVLAHRLEQMVTVIAAVYDGRSGRLTYAAAGHPEPLLVGRFDEPIRGSVSPPLGASAPTGLRQVTVTLPPGAAAFFHTDGLTDVKVRGGRLGRDGLAGEVLGLGPAITAEELLDDVAARSEAQPDDMVACILRPLDGAPDPVRERIDELQVTMADLDRHRGERFLAACRVPAGDRAAALTRARVVADRAGSALIKVRRGERLTSVSVGRPPRAVVNAATATAVGAR